ncbi:M28 family peptidase [Hymenobacter volaticus]|uniref:M28 family peptidase n=1 Tax=Hymenobacter volaticus TaxID=2932254 RepID=A0ABY4G4V8_9BACT|nr:M28 family peptidase [Hymenobacter volaticus]UOQ65925.1 M28 family peptidase [Hymenobacter volaticus]
MKHVLTLLAWTGLLPVAFGQGQLAKVSISGATVERVEKTLAANAMQGRALGTMAPQAARFLAAEFKRIGLKPLPGQTSFSQPFKVYETRTVQARVVLNKVPVAPENILLLSGQPQLRWTNSLPNAPRVVRVGPTADFRKEVMPLLSANENLLILLDPAHAERFQAQRLRFNQNGRYSVNQPSPTAVVLVLQAAPLPPALTFQIDGTTRIKELEAENVIGVLPGQDKAKAPEQVVFCAHYDHIGIQPAVAGDSIANGANDNASGTTAVVALAEYYAQQKSNARTLVFVAFTGEEVGSLGAQHFTQQVDPKQLMAAFNLEMLGQRSKFGPGTAFITGFDKSDFGAILQRNLRGTPFRLEPDPYPELNLFYQSDNATLARVGIPAHTISTAQLPTDKFYHSVDDEVQTLDLANLCTVVEAIARSASSIISGQDTPTRIAADASPTH